MTHGAVRMWLKLEGLAALVVALWFYAQHPGGWTRFALLFFAPDLAFLAYLAGPRAGAAAYNLVHSYSLPLGLLLLGTTMADDVLIRLALIWVAHLSCDRLLGFGLQYPTGVSETHLGRSGLARLFDHPA
jgi:Domain of unknown function (DUF4260)